MASTTATAQSYNSANVIGQVLKIGAAANTGKFLAAIGGLNGARRVRSQTFDMKATWSLDTPSPTTALISENTSLSAGTAKFYAKTPVSNVCQINKYDVIVSDLAEAAIDSYVDPVAYNAFMSPNFPQVSKFDEQAAMKMEQMNADWEALCLAGSIVVRAAVATNVAAGGLTDSTIGITTCRVNASSAALDSDMVSTLLTTMIANGAPVKNLAIVARPTYIDQLNVLYGFAPQDRNVGGVMLNQIFTTYGPVSLIWSNAAPANTLIIADLAFIRPVVMPHKGGDDIRLKEFLDGASAEKGYLEGYLSVDFGHESLHGKIYGLA
jgi:hypothetical protein